MGWPRSPSLVGQPSSAASWQARSGVLQSLPLMSREGPSAPRCLKTPPATGRFPYWSVPAVGRRTVGGGGHPACRRHRYKGLVTAAIPEQSTAGERGNGRVYRATAPLWSRLGKAGSGLSSVPGAPEPIPVVWEMESPGEAARAEPARGSEQGLAAAAWSRCFCGSAEAAQLCVTDFTAPWRPVKMRCDMAHRRQQVQGKGAASALDHHCLIGKKATFLSFPDAAVPATKAFASTGVATPLLPPWDREQQ